MGPQNHQVAMAAPASPTAGPTYPTLLLRKWLVLARLDARAAVRRVRPHSSADDRRLAALLAAIGVALVMLLGCAVTGFTMTTSIVLIALGFFGGLGGGLVLLFGPDDHDCEDELALVTELLPEAKRVWQEQRAAAKAARKVARAARRAERAARKQAAAADLVELVPVGGPPPVPALKGDGAYAVPVVGEVHVGRILADVCRDELPPVGQDKVLSAVVRIANTDRDSRAVSVEIAGRKVGRLSRADARALRRRVGRDGEQFKCRAAIHAGLECGRVHYDLRLDVNLGAPSGVVMTPGT
jgi:hypothetical protein